MFIWALWMCHSKYNKFSTKLVQQQFETQYYNIDHFDCATRNNTWNKILKSTTVPNNCLLNSLRTKHICSIYRPNPYRAVNIFTPIFIDLHSYIYWSTLLYLLVYTPHIHRSTLLYLLIYTPIFIDLHSCIYWSTLLYLSIYTPIFIDLHSYIHWSTLLYFTAIQRGTNKDFIRQKNILVYYGAIPLRFWIARDVSNSFSTSVFRLSLIFRVEGVEV